MSGTVAETCAEIRQNYGSQVMTLPTHRPVRRKSSVPVLFGQGQQRWNDVVRMTRQHLDWGHAVLIGTRSVRASDEISALLTLAGISHSTLNARDDSLEAAVVAQAGECGRVTVATNMAGRGTDIAIDERVRAAGGLVVILSEFHESSRVDRQLVGRCARQGDPGVAIMVASLEDDLFAKFLPRPVLRLAHVLAKRHPLRGAFAQLFVRFAQARAGVHQRRQREASLAGDDSLQQQLGFTGDLV